MDYWGLLWQLLAYGVLILLVIVLVFAIIEPGPLQNRRTFGRRRESAPEDEPEQSDPTKSTE